MISASFNNDVTAARPAGQLALEAQFSSDFLSFQALEREIEDQRMQMTRD